jgi:ABC-type multidrug transport system ATPase subunit
MISATHLTRIVADRVLLDDINLDVARGESIGLRGRQLDEPKTLLRILATLIRPTKGLLTVDGVDVQRHLSAVRRQIAYVDGTTVLAAGLTAAEYIWMIARARAVRVGPETSDLLVRAGIGEHQHIEHLPPPHRRALSVIAAIAVRPAILLLEDPLADVDPRTRADLAAAVAAARARGTVVVATSSDDELTAVCGRVVTFNGARLQSGLEPVAIGPTCTP